VLGEDHPDTLASGEGIAKALRTLGDLHAAQDPAQDTLARRRVLGQDHPQSPIST
jgi:hypothetical protein